MEILLKDPILRDIGRQMYELIGRLYPICRSITGEGVRDTLEIIREHIPLEVHEVPTGTRVFDWTVPEEWNIRDAYIKNSKGEKIVDFRKTNLHVLGYSVPVRGKFSLEELREHIFTSPEHPDRIPYRTSYYNRNWGFCMSHVRYEQLEEDTYEVVIDSELKKGSLTYGEMYIKGACEEEVLFTCYTCHPSMCNDNLSGIALLTLLAKKLSGIDLKYSYRFLFIPETIGAVTWLCLNENNVSRIKCGLGAYCLGDRGGLTYKRSRSGDAIIDRIAEKVLGDSGQPHRIIDFNPAYGSDERQFCSPGFDLPVGSLTRSPSHVFDEYHSSADNLDAVSAEHLADSMEKYIEIVSVIENDGKYESLNPKCEPQLGKRGLYSKIGSKYSKTENEADEMAMLWVLNMSDGTYSVLDIAVRSGMTFREIKSAADILSRNGLLRKVEE
ncbi:MAG: DUF4910 domain-containing protein [Candidatus Omnitrophota bacterium]|nr:DUF4910 domain-containing protein [Candidatus Omnitrophota bacterium]